MPLPLDLRAHSGLRGFLALWVALFHAALYSSAAGKGKGGITLQASAVMPAFFALSGFTIAVVYGRTQWAQPRCCAASCRCCGAPRRDPESACAARDDDDAKPAFAAGRFLRNRFARIAPTYWLALALGLPPTLRGFAVAGGVGASPREAGDIAGASVLSVFGLSTLAGVLPWGPVLDPPGWFVCTLLCFYLAFPLALPAAQRLSDAALARAVCAAYWLQWALWAAVVAVGIGALGSWWSNWRFVFALATFTPWSRFPIFFSGVFAGLLCLRAPPGEPLPAWPRALARLLPLPCLEPRLDDRLWARRTAVQSALLAALFAAVIVMENCLLLLHGTTAFPHFWLQCVVPFAQLELIVGLARGGGGDGTCIIGAALASRPLTWLGDVSMELFLLHWPVMMYFNWARSARGALAWPAGISATCRLTGVCARYVSEPWYDAWVDARTLPRWGIPVVTAASVALSALVHYGFAEPMRNLLRAPPPAGPRAAASLAASNGAPTCARAAHSGCNGGAAGGNGAAAGSVPADRASPPPTTMRIIAPAAAAAAALRP
jgi:peptidoglycan/LPS O-acetylase OafA/YrhL